MTHSLEGGWGLIIGFAIFAYFCGSIPFGLILTRLGGYGDIRAIGSGNIGATNVLRTGNKKLALATLLCDFLKGLVPVLIAWRFGPAAATAAAIGGTFGHVFPIWLGFKGGKGVATACGALFGYSWPFGVAAIATWLVVAALFRYSSLAAIITAVAVPIYAALFHPHDVAAWAIGCIALLVLLRHRANATRLLRGEEDKIAFRKRGA